MAVWQFQVEFLPRAWVESAGGNLSPLFTAEGRDTAPAWRDHQPAAPLDTLFSEVLPPAPSRYAGELYWGDEKRTDAHVWYGDGRVEGIGVRVDARNYSTRLLLRLARIADALDCMLLIPETQTVIPADVFSLRGALGRSRAARYVQGPPRFLDERLEERLEERLDERLDERPDDGPDSA